MRKIIFPFCFTSFAVAACFVQASGVTSAQTQMPAGCVQWKTHTDTVWVEQEVTENRVINETSYETKEVTKSRPRWISKQRERTITTQKPVTKTSERVVSRKVRKPVTTTKSRIHTRVEESYEDVTEMRNETYTVQKPVTETVYETQEVRVRKPVTTRRIEKEEVTVYRPQESTQTTMIPGTLLVPTQQPSARPRPRWLQRGYYSDPYSGQSVWRRGGLHWVDEPRIGQSAVPVAIPQQRTSTTLVPETIVKEKPIEVTSYVDEYETRKVPVEVERIVTETRTRKVPVTRRIPKRETIEYEVPYTETTYVDETITERIPVEETVMQTVTRREPYSVIEEKWEDYTETVRIPRTTTRRVPYVSMYRVPYLVEVRVPCNAAGEPVGRGQEIAGTHRLHPNWRKMVTKVDGAPSRTGAAETSVYKRNALGSATFDVPDARTVQSNVADTAAQLNGESVLDKSETLPDPPQDLEFANDRRSTETTLMKPLKKAKRKSDVFVPRETEESIEARRRIRERARALGIETEDIEEPPAEDVSTNETSALLNSSSPDETPSRANFTPAPLTIEVDAPPSADSANANPETPAVKDADDDTIEQDVDISRSTDS